MTELSEPVRAAIYDLCWISVKDELSSLENYPSSVLMAELDLATIETALAALLTNLWKNWEHSAVQFGLLSIFLIYYSCICQIVACSNVKFDEEHDRGARKPVRAAVNELQPNFG